MDPSGIATKWMWMWVDWYKHILGSNIPSNGPCPNNGHYYRAVCPHGALGNNGVYVIDDNKIYGSLVTVPKICG